MGKALIHPVKRSVKHSQKPAKNVAKLAISSVYVGPRKRKNSPEVSKSANRNIMGPTERYPTQHIQTVFEALWAANQLLCWLHTF